MTSPSPEPLRTDPTPTIRPATESDLPGILEIYNEAVLTTTATYDYEPRTLDQRKAWFADHQAGDYPIFVAIEGGQQIVGWSALNRYHDRPGYRFTTENSVYVAAAYRGRGIGQLLLKPLIEAARAPIPRHPGRHRCGEPGEHPLARPVRFRTRGIVPPGRVQIRPLAGRRLHGTSHRTFRITATYAPSTPSAHGVRVRSRITRNSGRRSINPATTPAFSSGSRLHVL